MPPSCTLAASGWAERQCESAAIGRGRGRHLECGQKNCVTNGNAASAAAATFTAGRCPAPGNRKDAAGVLEPVRGRGTGAAQAQRTLAQGSNGNSSLLEHRCHPPAEPTLPSGRPWTFCCDRQADFVLPPSPRRRTQPGVRCQPAGIQSRTRPWPRRCVISVHCPSRLFLPRQLQTAAPPPAPTPSCWPGAGRGQRQARGQQGHGWRAGAISRLLPLLGQLLPRSESFPKASSHGSSHDEPQERSRCPHSNGSA